MCGGCDIRRKKYRELYKTKKEEEQKRENFVEWTEWTDISSQIKVWENQKNYIAQLKKMNTKQLFINKTKN